LYPRYKTSRPMCLFLPPLLVVGSSILLPMPEKPQPPLSGKPVLVSACLAGRACRFDGSSNEDDQVGRLVAQGRAVLVCPEVDGGLGTPRPSAEIVGGDGSDVLAGRARVVTDQGRDVTEAYLEGARRALEAARRSGARVAILKARSPSCGKGAIYDGTFTRSLAGGDGVTAALLEENDIDVLTDEELGAG
jgi:uncharacterized protein YbbK (DUF523 family)